MHLGTMIKHAAKNTVGIAREHPGLLGVSALLVARWTGPAVCTPGWARTALTVAGVAGVGVAGVQLGVHAGDALARGNPGALLRAGRR
jgi:hypothetical protein